MDLTTLAASGEPFTDHLWLDVARALIASGGLLFAMLCAKVAYIVVRKDNPDVGDVCGWLSHAGFALIVAFFGYDRLGQDAASMYLVPIAIALVLGLASLSYRLQFPAFFYRRTGQGHRIDPGELKNRRV